MGIDNAREIAKNIFLANFLPLHHENVKIKQNQQNKTPYKRAFFVIWRSILG